MENKEFYIKYLDNEPVAVDTAYDANGSKRDRALATVGHLGAAYRTAVTPLLDHSSVAQLTLHLPDSIARSASGLDEEYFANFDENDTSLAPDCPLSALNSLGSTSKRPLIIKSKNDMEVDSVGNEMEVDISPEDAVSKLVKLISFNDENKTIFSAQDSMDDINLKDSILKLNIKSLNGVPNLLYSEEIYDHEKEIEIEMPIDRLVKIVSNVIVLIGVSGCGKTRTCYDLCRKDWGLYFDCTVDFDFIAMIKQLSANTPVTKTEETQIVFERLSEKLIECLIAARLLVLKTLNQRNRNLECFEWLCIHRSRRSKIVL